MAASISCPHCHRLLQMRPDFADAEVRCPSCGQVFIGGPQTNVTAQAPQAALEVRPKAADASWPLNPPRRYAEDDYDGPPERVRSSRGFRPGAGLGLAVKVMLGVGLFLGLVMLGHDYLQLNLAKRLMAGADVPEAELLSNDARQMLLGVAHLLIYLATAILFMVWFYRAHANLEPLGARYLTYSPGWAVGCWFVPILNLFRPVQIAQEIWRNSDPNAAPGDDVDFGRPTNSGLVGLWWALWIIASVVGYVSSRMGLDATTPASFRAATIAGMIAEVTNMLAAILAIAVVAAIDARQKARATALRMVDAPATIEQ